MREVGRILGKVNLSLVNVHFFLSLPLKVKRFM